MQYLRVSYLWVISCHPPAMTKADHRRQLLRALIDDRFDGVSARFADAVGIAASYVSRMLYPEGKAGAKGIGEDTIEKIEMALGIPGYFSGQAVSVSIPATTGDYVRVQQLDAEAGMGDGRVNDDCPEVIRAVDFEPSYIRAIVGFVPAPGRLVLVTGKGDSMLPTIHPGDVVVVDTGVTSFDGDGLYLINMGNGQQIKRLLDKGVVHVASDNRERNGEPFPMPAGTLVGGKVYLRNRIERFI